MFFSLKETVQWLGMTAFEMWVHLVTLLIFSVFLTVKVETGWPVSWWTVFIPLFTSDGLTAYFSVIVCIRLYLERGFRIAGMRIVWSGLILALLFVFKMLLCKKLEGEADVSHLLVLLPLFFLLSLLMIRACQVWSDGQRPAYNLTQKSRWSRMQYMSRTKSYRLLGSNSIISLITVPQKLIQLDGKTNVSQWLIIGLPSAYSFCKIELTGCSWWIVISWTEPIVMARLRAS